jgi:hypothetical protein
MNLTEPQAGSDLALHPQQGERPQGDGTTDQRHQDLHHLRRARHGREHRPPRAGPPAGCAAGRQGHLAVPGAEVPGQRRRLLGERNDLRCVSIEHKMGIHASPPAVMSFGERPGRHRLPDRRENRGLEYMFIMMNDARLGVGLQGVASPSAPTSRPWPTPANACRARSTAVTGEVAGHHRTTPDVRRMLMDEMRAPKPAAPWPTTAGLLDRAHAGRRCRRKKRRYRPADS